MSDLWSCRWFSLDVCGMLVCKPERGKLKQEDKRLIIQSHPSHPGLYESVPNRKNKSIDPNFTGYWSWEVNWEVKSRKLSSPYYLHIPYKLLLIQRGELTFFLRHNYYFTFKQVGNAYFIHWVILQPIEVIDSEKLLKFY